MVQSDPVSWAVSVVAIAVLLNPRWVMRVGKAMAGVVDRIHW